METARYLVSILALLMRQPKIGTILDEDGFAPEITYGQIGVKDYGALIKIYCLLSGIEEVQTTSIRKIDNGLGYEFTITAPITLKFFAWK